MTLSELVFLVTGFLAGLFVFGIIYFRKLKPSFNKAIGELEIINAVRNKMIFNLLGMFIILKIKDNVSCISYVGYVFNEQANTVTLIFETKGNLESHRRALSYLDYIKQNLAYVGERLDFYRNLEAKILHSQTEAS